MLLLCVDSIPVNTYPHSTTPKFGKFPKNQKQCKIINPPSLPFISKNLVLENWKSGNSIKKKKNC